VPPKPVDPDNVRRYLEGKFGGDLDRVWSAMQKLAEAYQAQELAHDAYRLYEQFRPAIPEGVKGWGVKGDLDLGLIGRLAQETTGPTGVPARRPPPGRGAEPGPA
jgi:hypothetical protein